METARSEAGVSGEAGFRFGSERSTFETTCRAAGGAPRPHDQDWLCERLGLDGELVPRITALHGSFVDGKLARIIIYSHEEPGPLRARLDERFPDCQKGTMGECIFGPGATPDEGMAVLLEDRREFGKAGSAVTLVSRRSVDVARRP